MSCLTQAVAEPAEAPAPRTTNVSEVVFPVYFHVIQAGPSLEEGNVPDEVIHVQMEVLNASFAGRQGGAATPFRFELAAIERTLNPEWFYDPNLYEARSTLRVGGASDLNIYTAQRGAFAEFPWHYKWYPNLDGVVLSFRQLPGMNYFMLGDVLVHEVGHWLGLFHTFQGGCTDPECVSSVKKKYRACEDFVDDTPAHTRPEISLCGPIDTCPDQPGLDPVFNFMNYVEDTCKSEFTPGQAARMVEKYSVYRAEN